MMQRARQIGLSLMDLLFPPRCAGCQASGTLLCAPCAERIQPLPSPLCIRCGVPGMEAGECARCRAYPPRFSGLRALCAYQEPLRACIHALKYRGQTRLAEPLGQLLALGYQGHKLQADLLLAVPLHPEREAQRGYNQAQLLAEVCAMQTGLPLRADILRRQRATPAQVELATEERRRNVQGAFVCASAFTTGALAQRNIVIIDDVCTTGATLEACAEPLLAAGAASVWGLVLARPYRIEEKNAK